MELLGKHAYVYCDTTFTWQMLIFARNCEARERMSCVRYLIAYYSRTGTTKLVAEELAKRLGSDVEEIIDTVDRRGVLGWLRSGRDGMGKRLTTIGKTAKDLSSYDSVVVGTPIWASNMSSHVRTYLSQNRDRFRKVGFLLIHGYPIAIEPIFAEMAETSGKEPVATLALSKKEVLSKEYAMELDKFVEKIMST
jgi:hypothetical protein